MDLFAGKNLKHISLALGSYKQRLEGSLSDVLNNTGVVDGVTLAQAERLSEAISEVATLSALVNREWVRQTLGSSDAAG